MVVDAEDQFGGIDPTYNGPVTIELANNATGTFVGTLTVNAVNGVATFSNLAIDTAGTYKLEATSPGLTTAVSTVHHDHPRRAGATGLGDRAPDSGHRGVAFGATLDVEDQYGNLETGYNRERLRRA